MCAGRRGYGLTQRVSCHLERCETNLSAFGIVQADRTFVNQAFWRALEHDGVLLSERCGIAQ